MSYTTRVMTLGPLLNAVGRIPLDRPLHPNRYSSHVFDLARAFRIVVDENPALKPEDAWAAVQEANRDNAAGFMMQVAGISGEIACSPITNDTAYAVALHEIGHILAPNGTLTTELNRAAAEKNVTRFLRLKVEEETAAWTWARHNALEWTAGMEQVFAFALGSYQATLDEYLRREAYKRIPPNPVAQARRAAKGAKTLAGWLAGSKRRPR